MRHLCLFIWVWAHIYTINLLKTSS